MDAVPRIPAGGRRAAGIAASALVVFVLLLLGGGGAIGAAFLFVVPVGLAAWWWGLRVGLVVAAGCIGLYLASTVINPIEQLALGIVVRGSILFATALVVSELRTRSRRLVRTQDELESVQAALTPPAMPKLPGLDVAVKFMAAEHGVSGDFYLLTNGPHATNVAILGDVCGHGPAAAQRATFARATLASIAASCDDPGEILDLVNRTLVDRWSDGNFLTATCIVHDAETHTVRWAIAGHPRPIRLSDLSELDEVCGMPLGVSADAAFPAHRAALDPPDGLLLYTDGLPEAQGSGERYGETRLRATLADVTTRPAAEIVERLAESVRQFTEGGLADDVCIIAMRTTPTRARRRRRAAVTDQGGGQGAGA